MSSRRIEVLHEAALSQLLSDSGLECIKPDIASSESSSSHEDSEEQGLPEQHEETTPVSVQENESTATAPSVAEEETPRIFPSPSLRRILPDSTRLIEEQNRIHVLPKEFKSSVDPESIPRISRTSPQKYIDALADIVGCTEYKTSLAEYWFLDTLACLLRRAQADLMDRPTQAVLILWFCEWMREMQRFDAADRQRMMKRFEDNMLSAARFVADKNFLPTPAQAGVHFEEVEVDSQLVAATESKHAVTFEGAAYECSLRDLTKITHYIYDFSKQKKRKSWKNKKSWIGRPGIERVTYCPYSTQLTMASSISTGLLRRPNLNRSSSQTLRGKLKGKGRNSCTQNRAPQYL
ncbi:uncharacterized protein LOC101736906 isoform X2 [Bombyx mori]|uniref:Uncharacterized protein n=1 Tax=Bombyx mori TaxID=7091 RepID=A0A8R2GEB6_BOMMO|nr:uncharacterized protein LOC101736906 isoform X2 [Bombyx mori]